MASSEENKKRKKKRDAEFPDVDFDGADGCCLGDIFAIAFVTVVGLSVLLMR